MNRCNICNKPIGEFELICQKCYETKDLMSLEDLTNIMAITEIDKVDSKSEKALKSILNISSKLGGGVFEEVKKPKT